MLDPGRRREWPSSLLRSLAAVAALSLPVLSASSAGGAPPFPLADAGAIPDVEVFDLAVDAYVFGYPLVLMDATRRVMTSTAAPESRPLRAPINRFAHAHGLPTPASKDVVSPNVDTLYSTAWLDLSREPLVLHLPNTHGRYMVMEMLDAWTNVFAAPGKRTTGTAARDFLIAGPGYAGPNPPALTEIRSPTEMAWIIGRIQTDGKGDDEIVNALQSLCTLTPLSEWADPSFHAPPLPVPEAADTRTAPSAQVAAMDATTFFGRLAALTKPNPPAAGDAPMVAKLERLGVVAGKPFELSALDPMVAETLSRAVPAGLQQISVHSEAMGAVENGWHVNRSLGKYGTRYLERASTAMIGLGANLSEDAIYAFAESDAGGAPLDGEKRYVIHFPKGQSPPVNAFWSVTAYGPEHFLVASSMHRHALGDRSKLKRNPDGSLDVYVQRAVPKDRLISNWLPAPAGPFNLILRMYWPKEEVLDGTWQPPPIAIRAGGGR